MYFTLLYSDHFNTSLLYVLLLTEKRENSALFVNVPMRIYLSGELTSDFSVPNVPKNTLMLKNQKRAHAQCEPGSFMHL